MGMGTIGGDYPDGGDSSEGRDSPVSHRLQKGRDFPGMGRKISVTSAHMGQGRDLGMESFPEQATGDPWGRLCIPLSR